MEIRGIDGGHIRIEPLFGGIVRGGGATPTLYASCDMVHGRFAGATWPDEPMVRIEAANLNRFVDELRTVERDRRGTATLAGRDLYLLFEVFDRAGHVRVAAELTDRQLEVDHRVALAFEVDPSMLLTILRDFEDLLNTNPSFPSGGR